MRVGAAATTTAFIATAMLAIAATPSVAAVERPQDARSSGANVNARRAEDQRSTLLEDPQLEAVAVRHARRMAARGEIYHNRNLGDEVDGWEALGENVGIGPSVGEVDGAFWNSQDHRNNILGGWDRMGIGVVDEGGDIYVVQVFKRSRDGSKSNGSNSSADSHSSASKPKPKPKPKPEPEPKPQPEASSRPSERPSSEPTKRRSQASDHPRSPRAQGPTETPKAGSRASEPSKRTVRTADAGSAPREVIPPSPPVALKLGAAFVEALTRFGVETAEMLQPETAVPLLA